MIAALLFIYEWRENRIHAFNKGISAKVKLPRSRFELGLTYSFSQAITVKPRISSFI